MTLDQIVNAGKKDSIRQEALGAYSQDTNSNIIRHILTKDEDLRTQPFFARLLARSPTMIPTQQLEYARSSAGQYQAELTSIVSGNLKDALSGFRDSKDLAKYILASPITPEIHPIGNDEKQLVYINAYEGQRFMDALKSGNEGLVQELSEKWIRSTADRLKNLDKAMIVASIWVYEQDPRVLTADAAKMYNGNIKSFTEGFDLNDGLKFVEDRFGKLDQGQKDVEALGLGRTVYKLNKR